jgi:polyvinyl alcohol dehydrogenase (cytochrome)
MRRTAGCLSLFAISFLALPVRSASAQDGAALYTQNCASCHDMGVDRAPGREALQTMTAERVLAALESGAMISMASRNSAAERRAIAQFVSGKSLSKKDIDMTPAAQAMCTAAGNFSNPLSGSIWNGWGDNTSNTRYPRRRKSPASK